MIELRSFAFNLAFFGWTALLAIVYLPLLALPRRQFWSAVRFWAASVLWLLKIICGLGHRVSGQQHLPAGPALIASKHQSAWDTLAFMLLLDRPAYVLKRELTWIPLFGWYLRRAGMIPVDRRGGAGALRQMQRLAAACIDEGRPLVIFPEGTRTQPGQTRAYHPGIAAMYAAFRLPVVPVALNSGLFWPRRAFRKQPGTIDLVFLPPIQAGLERKTFMKCLQDRIEAACAKLPGHPSSKEQR